MDAAFAVALAGVAWLAVFGHRGMAPCAGVMAFAVALRRDARSALFDLVRPAHFARAPEAVAALSMAAFALWVAGTAFWSPTPGAEWLGLTILAAVLAAAALVYEATSAAPERARRMACAYAATVSLAAAALMFEGLSGGYLRDIIPPTDHSPYRWKDITALGRGVTAMAPLAFPAAAILKRITKSWAVAFAPVFALFIAAANFSIFANVVALGAGAIAFAAALARPRLALGIVAAITIGALALVPFAALAIPADAVLDGTAGPLPASWAQRLVAWRAASERALIDCFPWGCGADYARAWRGLGEMIAVPNSPIAVPAMPLHPHNAFIQIWLELGLPGVIALSVAAAALFRALARLQSDAATSAAICGVIAAAFFSVMLEASIWQAWRLAVFALAAFGGAVSYKLGRQGRPTTLA